MASPNLKSTEKDLYDAYLSTCSDTFKQILADHSLVQPLRRLIIIGRLKYTDRNAFKEAQEQALKKIRDDIEDPALTVTGMLIIHETFFYHVAESSDETLGDVIRASADLLQERYVLGVKIIRNCTIVNRYFGDWNGCVIKTPNFDDSNNKELEMRPEESSVLTIARMIKKLEDAIFVLASYVRFGKPDEFEKEMNELVPIGVLLFREELEDLYKEKFFLSVEDYIDHYYRPPEYISFIEREWPPTCPVQDPKEFFDDLDRFEKQVETSLQKEEEEKKRKTKPGNFWWTVKATKK